MKTIIFILILLNCFNIYAGDNINPFKLVDMKCTDDNDESLDTTPQSPPMNIDDPETPGCNAWEVNILFDGDLTKDSKRFELPRIDLNYGIGNNMEVFFATPFVLNNSDTETISSIGKSEAGIKWMFYNQEKTGTSIAISPTVEFNMGGADSKGIMTGIVEPGTTISLPLLVSQKIGENKNGDIIVTANISYNKVIGVPGTTNPDSITAGAGIGFPVSKKTAVMVAVDAEEGISAERFGNRDQVVKVNVGFLHAITKRLSFFGSLGASVISNDGQTHRYFVIGMQYKF